MKILILGGGQDAFILSYLFFKKYNIRTSIAVRNLSNNSIMNWANVFECGSFIDNSDSIFNLIKEIKPDYIVNTAALSSSKECKKSPDLVYEINSYFPIKLIKFLSGNNSKLIHFGSILEKENRPNCIYTKSKIIASNFINNCNQNSLVENLCLPNHESPLRDTRFFIRELISTFEPAINSPKNYKIQINLNNGNTFRYWSWAPTLLGEIAEMIYKNEFNNDFEKFTTKLNLIQFTASVSKIFDIKEISINCHKSGNYKLEDIFLPNINKPTANWIKKLFTTKFESRFNLNTWCEEIK